MAKQTVKVELRDKPKKKRKGIHSKKKNSVSKKGKHYAKAYVGQGR